MFDTKKYTLISRFDKDVEAPTTNPKKANLFVSIYLSENNRGKKKPHAVIICRLKTGMFVNIDQLNFYNVYINNLETLNNCSYNTQFRPNQTGLDGLDKLALIFFDHLKILDRFWEDLNEIVREENYKIIEQQILDGDAILMNCYYRFVIQPLKRQIANLYTNRDKIYHLLDISR